MRTWNILNLGAGVQSTAVYLMACDVKLWGPNLLDFAIFADTAEWLRIKRNPADWAAAVEIDEALRQPGVVLNRKLTQKLYLHRSCEPLINITFNPRPTQREIQTNLNYSQECLGVCGV